LVYRLLGRVLLVVVNFLPLSVSTLATSSSPSPQFLVPHFVNMALGFNGKFHGDFYDVERSTELAGGEQDAWGRVASSSSGASHHEGLETMGRGEAHESAPSSGAEVVPLRTGSSPGRRAREDMGISKMGHQLVVPQGMPQC
jgi:hypothetical protein